MEAPPHIRRRDGVPALAHTIGDAPKGQSHGSQLQEDDFNAVSGGLPAPQSACVGQSTQSALEREINAGSGQAIQFVQQQAAGRQGGQFGFQG